VFHFIRRTEFRAYEKKVPREYLNIEGGGKGRMEKTG
jgi:hypothetical protein